MSFDWDLYFPDAQTTIAPTPAAKPAQAAPVYLTPECSGVTNVDWIVTCDGHTPWHIDRTKDRCIKVGSADQPCTLEDLIDAAPHLRRKILKVAAHLPNGAKSRITELVVTDDGLELGRCGKRANSNRKVSRGIIQPSELVDLIRPLYEAGATPMGSGTLYAGSRVYLQLKLGEYEVAPGDKVQPYLLITDSYDGSTELEITLCCERVVCANTWRVAQATGDCIASVRHSAHMTQHLRPVREVLAALQAKIEAEAGVNRAMAATKLSPEQRVEALCRFIPVPALPTDREATPGEKRARTCAENEHDRILTCLKSGRGSEIVDQDSVWGLFNAITEHYEHEGFEEKSETERLQNQFYGNAGNRKDAAYELLCSYLPGKGAAN